MAYAVKKKRARSGQPKMQRPDANVSFGNADKLLSVRTGL
jgi:hypothetical protein